MVKNKDHITDKEEEYPPEMMYNPADLIRGGSLELTLFPGQACTVTRDRCGRGVICSV